MLDSACKALAEEFLELMVISAEVTRRHKHEVRRFCGEKLLYINKILNTNKSSKHMPFRECVFKLQILVDL